VVWTGHEGPVYLSSSGCLTDLIPFTGGVTVSTCLVNVEERAEVPDLENPRELSIAANNNMALAA